MLSLDANRSTLTFGRTATLFGTLSTSDNEELANLRVVLEEKRVGDGPLVPVAASTTGPSGGFAFPVKPREDPDYRVRFAGDGGAETAGSPAESIQVEALVTSNASPSEVKAGRNVIVSGRVLPASQGQEVEIIIRRASTVVETKTLTLDANSAYKFAYKTDARDSCTVVASYAGIADKLSGESRPAAFRMTK